VLVAWLALSLAPQLELEWRAPAECPQADDVRARVDRSWATDAGGAIEAKGEIVATEDRARPWRLRVRLIAASGSAERELDGRSCDALADAAALMIAMAASGVDDPSEPVIPVIPEPAPAPAPEVAEDPRIDPTPPTPPTVIDTPARAWWIAAAALVAAALVAALAWPSSERTAAREIDPREQSVLPRSLDVQQLLRVGPRLRDGCIDDVPSRIQVRADVIDRRCVLRKGVCVP